MSIKSDNIIKKHKIINFSIDGNKEQDFNNDDKLIFSSGTPQLDRGKHQWVALYNPKNSK